MPKFKTREEAFASQNYDPNAVVITGMPDHIISAVIGFANLCVAHDAENAGFQPDYSDSNLDKFEAWHRIGSPSGAGFSYFGYVTGGTISYAGARLASADRQTANHIAEIFDVDYKAMKVYDRLAAEKTIKS